jgi:hypothetical protein
MAALAPGVSYALAGHRPTWGVVAGLFALWGAALLLWAQAWSWRWADLSAAWWLMAGAWVISAMGWWGWWLRVRQVAPSELVWEPTQRLSNGRQGVWRLFTPAWPTGLRAAQVAVVFDWQVIMLVQFQAPQGLRVWCWLWRGSEPGHWLALRRAVFHQPSQHKPE